MGTDPESPGTEVERHAAPAPAFIAQQGRSAMMTDDEIQRTYRQASALAASRLFKDVESAEKAFAKLLIGRTLGLNEAQSLSLYAMEGKIELPYPLMGQLVRARDGYDYRPAWIKESPTADGAPREAVYCDEDTASDLREVVGAAIEFTVDGKLRGVSTWTVDDSQRAGLLKDRGTKASNHKLYPRNLFLARAMSNGLKWFVPEVLQGMPVYAEGEIQRVPNLAEGEGDGEGPGWGDTPIAAAHEVEKIARRAKRLGHAGYASIETAQMALRGQSEDAIRAWIQKAHETLNDLAVAKDPTPPEVVDGEAQKDAQGAQDAALAPSGPSPQGDVPVDPLVERRTALIDRIRLAEDAGDDDGLAEFSAELDALDAETKAASDPGQESLL